MLYDEEAYPEPGQFVPERWLDKKLHGDKDIDPLDLAFGFGRRCVFHFAMIISSHVVTCRVCPGKYMAQEVLFTVIATTLAVFNIRKVKDSNGHEIIPNAQYTNGSIMYVEIWPHDEVGAETKTCLFRYSAPLPFECDVKPRSAQAAQLVEHAVAALS